MWQKKSGCLTAFVLVWLLALAHTTASRSITALAQAMLWPSNAVRLASLLFDLWLAIMPFAIADRVHLVTDVLCCAHLMRQSQLGSILSCSTPESAAFHSLYSVCCSFHRPRSIVSDRRRLPPTKALETKKRHVHVVSCQVMSCRFMSCCVMSCCFEVMSWRRHAMSCHAMPCHVMSCHVMSCQVTSCRVVSCDVVSCHVVSCHVMSCHFVLF